MTTKRLHRGEYKITEGEYTFTVSKQWISGTWIAALEDWTHERYEESEIEDEKLKYIKQRITEFSKNK